LISAKFSVNCKLATGGWILSRSALPVIFAKRSIQSMFKLVGRIIGRKKSKRPDPFPVELTSRERGFFEYVKQNKLSMTSDERMFTTMMACKYVVELGIEGDFVECGVWRGGNALLAAAMFKIYAAPRKVYLFDTFEGMTQPTDFDRRASTGESALRKYLGSQRKSHNSWCYASLDDVKSNFQKAGLLDDNIVFVKGDVVSTLAVADNVPARISVLRLDTDWYESSKAELEALYPRLSIGGALLIDDYGHWAGCRQATDDFFVKYGNRPFLQYTDYTGRVGIKLH
jgi:O-methyltransferase